MRKSVILFAAILSAGLMPRAAVCAEAAMSSPMRALRYVLMFQENGVPDKSGKHITADGTATLPDDFDAAAAGGEHKAQFHSLVTMGKKGTFTEKGTITFGGGTLMFATSGPGSIGKAPVPGLESGYAIWRVVGGTGVFEGAKGFIASRFSVSDTGDVMDGQAALIYLKQ